MNILSAQANLPTRFGDFDILVYVNKDGKENVVIKTKQIKQSPILRIHSECLTSEVFGSLKCDCKDQLDNSLNTIGNSGNGLVIYLRQEGRGIGLVEKIKAYALQDLGMDTVQANLELGHNVDNRDYIDSVEILNSLDIKSVRLITNNPLKKQYLQDHEISVDEIIKVKPIVNKHNEKYLRVKNEKTNHWIDL